MTGGPYKPGKTRLSASRLNETDALSRRRFRVGPGLKITETGTDVRIDLEPQAKRAAQKVASPSAAQVKVTNVTHSDYVECHIIDDGGEQPDIVYVAKPWFLRGADTWSGRTRAGVNYSNYQNNHNTRRASGSSTAKTQWIVPIYAVDDILYAAECKTTGVYRLEGDVQIPVEMIDVNADGRMWANV